VQNITIRCTFYFSRTNETDNNRDDKFRVWSRSVGRCGAYALGIWAAGLSYDVWTCQLVVACTTAAISDSSSAKPQAFTQMDDQRKQRCHSTLERLLSLCRHSCASMSAGMMLRSLGHPPWPTQSPWGSRSLSLGLAPTMLSLLTRLALLQQVAPCSWGKSFACS
jgi:hypothetical protein